MESTKKKTKSRKSPSTAAIPNSAKPPRNKYSEAALKHQGSFIVYDPHFML